jgi:ABC-type Na+ efflux pump permease subunit
VKFHVLFGVSTSDIYRKKGRILMKKFWILLSAITFAIGLTACSAEKEAEPEKKETEEAAKPAVNPKSAMYKFYMSVVSTINEADADLNAYEGEEDPKAQAELKAAASASAAAVAANVEALEVPADLKDQKADLEVAIKDLAAAYSAKAEELKKDAPNMEAADATFAQGEEKLAAAFESVGMNKPVLSKEL